MEHFDAWNRVKKKIQEKEVRKLFFHVGDVWWCNVGLNIGVEENGKGGSFSRPVVILKKFGGKAVLAVPVTSQIIKNGKNEKFYYEFSHKGKRFAAILSQVRLISTKRLNRKIHRLSKIKLDTLKSKLKALL